MYTHMSEEALSNLCIPCLSLTDLQFQVFQEGLLEHEQTLCISEELVGPLLGEEGQVLATALEVALWFTREGG